MKRGNDFVFDNYIELKNYFNSLFICVLTQQLKIQFKNKHFQRERNKRNICKQQKKQENLYHLDISNNYISVTTLTIVRGEYIRLQYN